MIPKRITTHSELATFRDCQQAWKYKYDLGLRPRITQARINDGKVLHAGLEAHYKGHSFLYCCGVMSEELRKATPEEDWPYHNEKTLPHLVKVFKRYLAHWQDREFIPAIHRLSGREMVEFEFIIPVYTPAGRASTRYAFAGKIDLVTRIFPGDIIPPGLWIVDHKTTRMLIGEDDFDRLIIDQQMRSYAYALSIYLGEPIAGVIHNKISTKELGSPKINKDGTVSAAKCTCDVEDFTALLERQDEYLCSIPPQEKKALKLAPGIDFDRYSEEVRRLSRLRFFDRGYHSYTEDDMREAQMEIYTSVLAMSRATWFSRNTHACDHWSGCSYKPLCMGEAPDGLYTQVEQQHMELTLNPETFRKPAGRPFIIDGQELMEQRIVSLDDVFDAVNA